MAANAKSTQGRMMIERTPGGREQDQLVNGVQTPVVVRVVVPGETPTPFEHQFDPAGKPGAVPVVHLPPCPPQPK
jgi:hypothetical protein